MSIINHQRVLITGAAGFVGSYLAKKLINYGIQVRGIDSLIRGQIENVQPLLQYKNYSFTRGNILNKGRARAHLTTIKASWSLRLRRV